MENIQVISDSFDNEHVIIYQGDGEFTSMPKSVYDEQQAALAEK